MRVMSLILAPLFLAAAIEMPKPSGTTLRKLAGEGGIGGMIEFFVDPKGRVVDCRDKKTKLVPEYIAPTCKRAMGRDIGRGARDHQGDPIHSVVDGGEIIGMLYPARLTSDLAVMVASMPGGQKRLRTVSVVLINEQGRVDQCEGESPFARAACQQAVNHQFDVRFDADGNPVAFVDSLIVDFVLEEGSGQEDPAAEMEE